MPLENYSDPGTMEELRSKTMDELVEVLQQHTLEEASAGEGGAPPPGAPPPERPGAPPADSPGTALAADLAAAAAAVPYSSVPYSPAEPEQRYIGVSHDSRARTWRPLLMLRLRGQGEERKNGNPTRALAGCKTAEEGAAAHDVAVIWRSLHHAEDYGPLEAQKLNFSLEGYRQQAALFDRLLQLDSLGGLQDFVKLLRDAHQLHHLANTLPRRRALWRGGVWGARLLNRPSPRCCSVTAATGGVARMPRPRAPKRRGRSPEDGGTPHSSSSPTTAFLGIAYDPLSRLWLPQANVGVDAAQRPAAGAEPSVHSMAPCTTPGEAALLRDVALAWLQQPLGAGPEFFNFPVGRYSQDASLLQRLWQLPSMPELQEYSRQLRDSTSLVRLAAAYQAGATDALAWPAPGEGAAAAAGTAVLPAATTVSLAGVAAEVSGASAGAGGGASGSPPPEGMPAGGSATAAVASPPAVSPAPAPATAPAVEPAAHAPPPTAPQQQKQQQPAAAAAAPPLPSSAPSVSEAPTADPSEAPDAIAALAGMAEVAGPSGNVLGPAPRASPAAPAAAGGARKRRRKQAAPLRGADDAPPTMVIEPSQDFWSQARDDEDDEEDEEGPSGKPPKLPKLPGYPTGAAAPPLPSRTRRGALPQSRYRGVYFSSQQRKWMAVVELAGAVQTHLPKNNMGSFGSEKEAALAADITSIWRDVRLGRVGDGWQRHDYAFDHDWYCEEQLHNHLAALQGVEEMRAYLRHIRNIGALRMLTAAPTAAELAAGAAHRPLSDEQALALLVQMPPPPAPRKPPPPLRPASRPASAGGAAGSAAAGGSRYTGVFWQANVRKWVARGFGQLRGNMILCGSEAEAACAHDMARLWSALRAGGGAGDGQQYNYGFARYMRVARLVPRLRRLYDDTQLKAYLRQLRDGGWLIRLAEFAQQEEGEEEEVKSPVARGQGPSAASAPFGPGGGGGDAPASPVEDDDEDEPVPPGMADLALPLPADGGAPSPLPSRPSSLAPELSESPGAGGGGAGSPGPSPAPPPEPPRNAQGRPMRSAAAAAAGVISEAAAVLGGGAQNGGGAAPGAASSAEPDGSAGASAFSDASDSDLEELDEDEEEEEEEGAEGGGGRKRARGAGAAASAAGAGDEAEGSVGGARGGRARRGGARANGDGRTSKHANVFFGSTDQKWIVSLSMRTVPGMKGSEARKKYIQHFKEEDDAGVARDVGFEWRRIHGGRPRKNDVHNYPAERYQHPELQQLLQKITMLEQLRALLAHLRDTGALRAVPLGQQLIPNEAAVAAALAASKGPRKRVRRPGDSGGGAARGGGGGGAAARAAPAPRFAGARFVPMQGWMAELPADIGGASIGPFTSQEEAGAARDLALIWHQLRKGGQIQRPPFVDSLNYPLEALLTSALPQQLMLSCARAEQLPTFLQALRGSPQLSHVVSAGPAGGGGGAGAAPAAAPAPGGAPVPAMPGMVSFVPDMRGLAGHMRPQAANPVALQQQQQLVAALAASAANGTLSPAMAMAARMLLPGNVPMPNPGAVHMAALQQHLAAAVAAAAQHARPGAAAAAAAQQQQQQRAAGAAAGEAAAVPAAGAKKEGGEGGGSAAPAPAPAAKEEQGKGEAAPAEPAKQAL
eukprot:scaffold2.g7023.t1